MQYDADGTRYWQARLSNGSSFLDAQDNWSSTNTANVEVVGLADVDGNNADNSNNDELFGDSGNNEILSGAGNDTLHGQEGNDKLRGESGKDELFGDSGNDKLKGGSGKDELFGGEGNDQLFGGSGKDTLVGGLESISKQQDTLTGGAGKDIFVLGDSNTVGYNLGGNSDSAIITDLAEGDKIQLKGTTEDYILIKNLNLVGSSDLDTAIAFGSPQSGIATSVGDIIGIIQDNTSLINFMSSSFFNYV